MSEYDGEVVEASAAVPPFEEVEKRFRLLGESVDVCFQSHLELHVGENATERERLRVLAFELLLDGRLDVEEAEDVSCVGRGRSSVPGRGIRRHGCVAFFVEGCEVFGR